MISDFHMHTNWSSDSPSRPKDMVREAIRKGMDVICITDHHELDYIEPGWEQDLEQYHKMLREMQEKYQSKI